MSGIEILRILGEYGPVEFVEFTHRSRRYVPRPGGGPERRALYVHYMDTPSVEFASSSWREGGLSEKYIEDPERPGEYATLYVRQVRASIFKTYHPLFGYKAEVGPPEYPMLRAYRHLAKRFVYGWDGSSGCFWDDGIADLELSMRARASV